MGPSGSAAYSRHHRHLACKAVALADLPGAMVALPRSCIRLRIDTRSCLPSTFDDRYTGAVVFAGFQEAPMLFVHVPSLVFT